MKGRILCDKKSVSFEPEGIEAERKAKGKMGCVKDDLDKTGVIMVMTADREEWKKYTCYTDST